MPKLGCLNFNFSEAFIPTHTSSLSTFIQSQLIYFIPLKLINSISFTKFLI